MGDGEGIAHTARLAVANKIEFVANRLRAGLEGASTKVNVFIARETTRQIRQMFGAGVGIDREP